LFASVIGDAWVPDDAAMELPPFVSVTCEEEEASVRLYPVALFVLTVTVSLALVAEPDEVGVIASVTVPLVLILMVEPIVASIVVPAVWLAANDAAGTRTLAITPSTVPPMIILDVSLALMLIPHIIMDCSLLCTMLMAKSRHGVFLSPED
jgi:hypothetical protein